MNNLELSHQFIAQHPPLARRLAFHLLSDERLIEVDLTAEINKAARTHLSLRFAPRADICYVLYSQRMSIRPHQHQRCPH